MDCTLMTNPEMPRRVNDYFSYLIAIKGVSKNTVLSYSYDLRSFFRFLKAYRDPQLRTKQLRDILISDIDDNFLKSVTLYDIYAFISSEQSKGNSNKTSSRKIGCLRSFFSYLYRKIKILDSNPTEELESPKIDKRKPIYLSEEESWRLLSVTKGRNVERNKCILIIFLNCGLRLAELCDLNISKIKGDTVTVIGKGNKERTIYLNDVCLEYIENYMVIRRAKDTLVDPAHKDALFLSEQNNRIGRRTVEYLVNKCLSHAGLDDKNYSTHKLRHTAATLLYRNGVDILSLKELLGHENISTTQIYTHLESDQLRSAVSLSPFNKKEVTNKRTPHD